ncbi:unnamed protein product [Closterium sp. NIES-64]|nr:unnamed protein product [Closterium sp. NIES-64]
MVSPARADPPFPVERLPDDVLALVLRSLAQTSFRHALVSKRWLRLATSALSHFNIEIHHPEQYRNAQLAWLPLPRLLSALRRFPTLTHVSLGEFSILFADGDALFQCLAATCPRLSHLTVEHQLRMAVTVDGLASLFRGCRKLRELRLLTTAGFPHLPPSLSLLTDLQTLHVCAHAHSGKDSLQELVSPPESIGALQQLRELRLLSLDNIRDLPESLGNLPRLKTLELVLPTLQHLPERLCESNLPACLEKLSLTNCYQLKELPPSLYKLTRLESLHVESCSEIESLKPLTSPNPPDGSGSGLEWCSLADKAVIGALCTAALFAVMVLISQPLLTMRDRIEPSSAATLTATGARSGSAFVNAASLLLVVVLLLISHVPSAWLYPAMLLAAALLVFSHLYAAASAPSAGPVSAPNFPAASAPPAAPASGSTGTPVFDSAANGTEQHPGLVSLAILKVSYCTRISSLPENFSFPALHTLTLYCLGNLENLLDLSSRQLPQLQHLELEGVGVEAEPWLLDCFTGGWVLALGWLGLHGIYAG